MCLDLFLPHLRDLDVESVTGDATHLTVVASPRAPTAVCPLCQQPSRRVHSRYRRTLADLPWSATPVRLSVHVRRFRCMNKACARTIFCERLEPVAATWARRTHLACSALIEIGMALGGRAGAALAHHLRLETTRQTVVAVVCAAPLPPVSAVRILGIDDFAFKRGRRYGTLLCDHEQGRAVDLLPDRSAATVATWLQAHPGVEIITRDRATVYAEGATRGAPDAVQVVDRFHLMQNLQQALQEDLNARSAVLQEVAMICAQAAVSTEAPADAPAPALAPPATSEGGPPPSPHVVPAAALHTGGVSATKQAHYAAVHALHAQGKSHHAIAAEVGINRRTVRRYLEAPEGLQPRVGRCTHEPYLPYLLQRWNEGCHNGRQLWREICDQGYTGARTTLSPLFTQLRHVQGLPSRQRRPPAPSSPPLTVARPVRVRQIAFHFIRSPKGLETDEQAYLVQLCAHDPTLASTYRLTQDFVRLLHERHGAALEAWMEEVAQQGTPHLQAFAAGLRQDWAAVQAGLTLSWNNGRSEGLVNKLKMIKRQMFGRAGFTLLRQRVLHRRA